MKNNCCKAFFSYNNSLFCIIILIINFFFESFITTSTNLHLRTRRYIKDHINYSNTPINYSFKSISQSSSTYLDKCSTKLSCGQCILSVECGWCNSTGQCLPGNSYGDNLAICENKNWNYNKCSFVPCTDYNSQRSCISQANCVWCSNKDSEICISLENSTGPNAVSCSRTTQLQDLLNNPDLYINQSQNYQLEKDLEKLLKEEKDSSTYSALDGKSIYSQVANPDFLNHKNFLNQFKYWITNQIEYLHEKQNSPSMQGSSDTDIKEYSIENMNKLKSNKEFKNLSEKSKKQLLSQSEKLALDIMKKMIKYDSVENSFTLTNEFKGIKYFELLMNLSGDELDVYLSEIKIDKAKFLSKIKLLVDSASSSNTGNKSSNNSTDSSTTSASTAISKQEKNLNSLSDNLKGLSKVHSFFLDNTLLTDFKFSTEEFNKFSFTNTTLISYTPTIVVICQKMRFYGKGFNYEGFFSHNSDYDSSSSLFLHRGLNEIDLSYFHFNLIDSGYHEYFSAGKTDFIIDHESENSKLNQIKTVVLEFPYLESDGNIIQTNDFIENIDILSNGWQNMKSNSIVFNLNGIINMGLNNTNVNKNNTKGRHEEKENIGNNEVKNHTIFLNKIEKVNNSNSTNTMGKTNHEIRIKNNVTSNSNNSLAYKQRKFKRNILNNKNKKYRNSDDKQEDSIDTSKAIYLITYSFSSMIKNNIMTRLYIQNKPYNPSFNYEYLTMGSNNIYLNTGSTAKTLSIINAFTIDSDSDFELFPQFKVIFNQEKQEVLESDTNLMEDFYKHYTGESNVNSNINRRTDYGHIRNSNNNNNINYNLKSSFIQKSSNTWFLNFLKNTVQNSFLRQANTTNIENVSINATTTNSKGLYTKDKISTYNQTNMNSSSFKANNTSDNNSTENINENKTAYKFTDSENTDVEEKITTNQTTKIIIDKNKTTNNKTLNYQDLNITKSSIESVTENSKIREQTVANLANNKLISKNKSPNTIAIANKALTKDFFEDINKQAEAYQAKDKLNSLVDSYNTLKKLNENSYLKQIKGSFSLLKLPNTAALYKLNYKSSLKFKGDKAINSIPGVKKTLQFNQIVNLMFGVNIVLTFNEINTTEFRLYLNGENVCDFDMISKNEFFVVHNSQIVKQVPAGEYIVELVALVENDVEVNMTIAEWDIIDMFILVLQP